MTWSFEPVSGPHGYTEGPVWDGGGVVFSDMKNGTVRRYDVETGRCRVRFRDTNAANGLKLADDGSLYVCEMAGRRLARYDRDGRGTVVDSYRGERLNSPNDLAIDGEGRVWFTDPFYDVDFGPDEADLELDHRSVYRVEPGDPATLTRMTDETTNPNGLLVSPAGDRLYVAQSDPHGREELWAYPIREGTLGDYEVLHDFAPHRGIDGMCFDADGNVVATAGNDRSGPGPTVYVFAPSGRVVETHETPDRYPTNCCFGGDDLGTLYLTGLDGYLYAARTDRTGHLGPPATSPFG